MKFISPIIPPSSYHHLYIITSTDYLTKWVEEKPTGRTTSKIVYEFVKESLLVRFGVPLKIFMDNVTLFYSTKIVELCYNNIIHLNHYLDYFHQGNGQKKPSNKNLISIMKNLVSKNQND